jgi:hypothetical protein
MLTKIAALANIDNRKYNKSTIEKNKEFMKC